MWGHCHLWRLVRSEGRGGAGFEEWFGAEVCLRKLVIGGIEAGRKGLMPLIFQE